MADYNLDRLHPRAFEHLTQALAMKVIAPGITPFGDGADGGREATYKGKVPYPSTEDPWDGYLIIQCKFRQRPSADRGAEGNWALDQLQKDLNKFFDGKRALTKPDYYVFVTNVTLTPTQDSGSKDRATQLLASYCEAGHIKGYDVWDYDKLCRLLDANRNIANAYAASIIPDDVIAQMMEFLQEQRNDFARVMSLFLQREMRKEQFVRLEQAGQSAEHKTALGQVFVDLPAFGQPVNEAPQESTLNPGVVSELLDAGAMILGASTVSQNQTGEATISGRYVLVGGPGQGKSTVGQFLCQLYRVALLDGQPRDTLANETLQLLDLFKRQCEENKVELPGTRRFPVRIVLEEFAAELARGETNSLLTYILKRINTLTDHICTVDDLRRWLGAYPWLLVLDGLDEVPSSSNRPLVLEKIEDFWTETSLCRANLLVVATTRPQGYGQEFTPALYTHRYLSPLSKFRALHYAERLVDTKYSGDSERRNLVLRRLSTACDSDTTARLMRSPLQVTIMATLVDRIGEPPQERYQLFQKYYEVIYQRETERNIPSARVLRSAVGYVNAIHRTVGFLLQAESERDGATESKLSSARFESLVREHLESEGHEGSDLDNRVREITEAALNRLVFLVGLESDQIGFEIRSLQEFMAAEALMDGSDGSIRERLEEIGPVEHWRNVFLFASGKCAVERQHLRDTIFAICDGLNLPDSEDGIAEEVLTGSRLALDILLDGVQGEQPKYRKLFGKCALRLLELPDAMLGARVASIYEPGLETLFQDYFRGRMREPLFVNRIGTWSALKILCEKGISWALEMADTYWPSSALEGLCILELNEQGRLQTRQVIDEKTGEQQTQLYIGDQPFPKEWAVTKLVQVVPSVAPPRLEKLSAPTDNQSFIRPLFPSDDDRIPSWCSAVNSLFRKGIGNRLRIPMRVPLSNSANEADAVKERDRNGEDVELNSRLSLRSIHQELMSEITDLSYIPFQNTAWLPYICGSRFIQNPNKDTLATELAYLADQWEPQTWKRSSLSRSGHPIGLDLPWPLETCLMFARSQDDLHTIAEKARQGNFGDTQDWDAAEKRWSSQGVGAEDWSYLNDENWPFDSEIGTIGFPLGAASWDLFYSYAENLWVFFWELFEQLPPETHHFARIRFATIASLAFAFDPDMTLMSGVPRYPIEPKQLKAILSAASESFFGYHFLQNIEFPNSNCELTESWIAFFEWLGTEEFQGYVSRCSIPFISQIAAAYESSPDQTGLLNILSSLTLSGSRVNLDPNLIDPSKFTEPELRMSGLFIRLSLGGWNQEEAETLASITAELAKQRTFDEDGEPTGTDVVKFANDLVHKLINVEERKNYTLALWKNLKDTSSDGLTDTLKSLEVFMRDRKSCLDDPVCRARLVLPSSL